MEHNKKELFENTLENLDCTEKADYNSLLKDILLHRPQELATLEEEVLDYLADNYKEFEYELVAIIKDPRKALKCTFSNIAELLKHTKQTLIKLMENSEFICKLLHYFIDNKENLGSEIAMLSFIPKELQLQYPELVDELMHYYGTDCFEHIPKANYDTSEDPYIIALSGGSKYLMLLDYLYIINDILLDNLISILKPEDVYLDSLQYVLTYIPNEFLLEHLDLFANLLRWFLDEDTDFVWHSNILTYIPPEIQDKMPELIYEVFKKVGPRYFEYISYNITENSPEMYLYAIKNDINNIDVRTFVAKQKFPWIYDEIYEDILSNPEKIILIVKNLHSLDELPNRSRFIENLLTRFSEDDELLNKNKSVLTDIPYDVQERYPDLIIKIYQKLGADYFIDLSPAIAQNNPTLYKEATENAPFNEYKIIN